MYKLLMKNDGKSIKEINRRDEKEGKRLNAFESSA
jgi:hypothetical protein